MLYTYGQSIIGARGRVIKNVAALIQASIMSNGQGQTYRGPA